MRVAYGITAGLDGRPMPRKMSTIALDRAPAIRALLESLPCKVSCARMMTVARGGRIIPHEDAWHSPMSGLVRLQFVVVSPQECHVLVGGCPMNWNAGELWYADYSKTHSVHNCTEIDRVTLTIDIEISESFLRTFPSIPSEGAFVARPDRALSEEEMRKFQCHLFIPESVRRLLGAAPVVKICCTDGALYVQSAQRVRLIPVSEHELRIAGCPPSVELRFQFDQEAPSEVLLKTAGMFGFPRTTSLRIL